MANRRYLYFSQQADVAGYPDIAEIFRSTAEGETGHALGHMEQMQDVGDPVTGLPINGVEEFLLSAIEGEVHEYTNMYPGMMETAREEGFDDIADWFETLSVAERSHANRFKKTLEKYRAGEFE